MKKIFLLFILMLLPLNVFAASGSIKASISSTKVTLNNTVSVTVKVSSDDYLGSWQFNISYDKKKLSLISGDTSVVGYGDGSYKSKSYTYKFKAITEGSANISVDNAKIVDWNTESAISTSTSGLTLTIKEPVVINYSSDNNLKSLSIDGFEISPEFNKSTLSYSAKVLATTNKINIKASANDTKAKISGVGEKDVIEGNNKFQIVVTAENGSTKTYELNVIVPEKDPIKYSFNNVEYEILRKLPEKVPNSFNASTIKFNDEEVACLQNEKLNLTLIYLRNNKNEEAFYIYDLTNNTVSLYNEISNNDGSIYLVSPIKELSNLIKTKVEINEVSVDAYQIKEKSNHYIIYGKDLSTGEGNYYIYDDTIKSFILFNEEDYTYSLDNNSVFKILSIALGALAFLFLIIIIIMANTKKKMNIMINRLNDELYKSKKENIVEEENNDNHKKKKHKK